MNMVYETEDPLAEPDKNEESGEEYTFYTPFKFEPDPRGLGNYLFNRMKKHRHHIAQYIADTDEEQTYAELLQRCVRTACHLSTRSLTKDDVVVLCSYNHKESSVPFIASLFLNVPVASMDPTLSLMESAYLLKDVRPKIIFVVPEGLELMETSVKQAGLDTEIVVYGSSDTHTEFSSFLEPHENEEKFAPTEADSLKDTAVIMFSSGTTGLPKGIILNHLGLLGQALLLPICGSIGTIYLTYSTLYWISAVLYQLAGIIIGGAKVTVQKMDPHETWKLIDKYKVTSLFGAPSLAAALLKVGRPDGLDTSSLWSFIVGGGYFPKPLLLELRDLLPGTFVYNAYGQTEVSGVSTTFKTANVKDTLYLHSKPTSVGMVIPGIKAKVVDVFTGAICGPNEEGELRIKSEFLMSGYHNHDTSDSFDSEGWMKTGDIVTYDEDGCFYIKDRIKEMIKYKGFQIAPAMLEQLIMTHSSVAQVVIIGIPHDADGDHPMAVIVPKESSTASINEEDIIKFVDERVSDTMRLRAGVKFVSSIPMTPSGKIRRRDVKKMVLDGNL
ncbi:uncharacterized protein LOC126892162 isoform X1 [Diabrotica virgifera virgifera]|uniref:4-coumarate--CoA ligase 1-like n=1 Tax=Diabrotica virgifera virgifera TaxID=50390 RepID=A0ABM5L574_DIAVI|nr:uncharacterized protein LOC126892162 isoform X1 [Diabrotica virgifera virgifera]